LCAHCSHSLCSFAMRSLSFSSAASFAIAFSLIPSSSPQIEQRSALSTWTDIRASYGCFCGELLVRTNI
jgi:hypothetical protein